MENAIQTSSGQNLRDILTIIFKHKYKILITALVIFLGTIFYAVSVPQLYEAKSVVLIKYGREYLPRPEDSGTRSMPAVTPQTVINGEISILTSLDLFSRLVSKMGAVNIYPELSNMSKGNLTAENTAIRILQKDIKVRNIPNSSLVEVSFTHSNPEMVAAVINNLVELYKEKHLEIFSGEGTGFLENQLGKSQKKLKESESDLASFKEINRVFSFEEQKTALIGQRTTLDTTLKAAQSQISELEQRIAFTKSPRWTIDAVPELRTSLAALEQRESELLERYKEGSRTIQSQRQEIQALKDSIKRKSEEQRQIELSKTEGELSVAKAKADTLRRQLGQVEGDIRTLDARGRNLQELKREAALQEQSYQNYAKKLEESLISDEMDKRKIVAISVIEKAPVFRIPREQKLDKKQMVAAGFFGSIAAGIALAFLLEFMSACMTTPMSAEKRLGIPVMVAITKKG
jgi:polysaccharide biosynthesis protein PslE